jgi:hypothetical protein
VPHITDAIQEWVERVAQQPVKGNIKPEVCIVELGGTIGDIEGMPFVEAFRQFQFRVKVSKCVIVNFLLRFINDFYVFSAKISVLRMFHWCHSLERRANQKQSRHKPQFVSCAGWA